MIARRVFATLLSFAVALPVVVAPVRAQDDNLLADPGFEDTNMRVIAQEIGEGTTFAVNASWGGWYTTSPRNEEWQNRIPNGTGRNNDGMGFVRSGNRSMELSRGFATFTAAVYQTVSVPQGATVRGSAWYVMDLSEGAGAQARVGIHPSGGTNPYDSAVIWSEWGGNQPASNGWRELSTTATTTGSQVTIFLFATQRTPTAQNGIYWDDASLVITAAPPEGSAPPDTAGESEPQAPAPPAQPIQAPQVNIPTPQPPATAVTVNPLPPNPDGSIIHTVGAGETTSAIARAYGVSMQIILNNNPSLGDGTLIRPGQRITIRPPDDAGAGGAATLPPATFTPAPTEVAQAQPVDPQITAICVLMYHDRNRNGLRDPDDPPVSEGGILLEREGQTMDQITTADSAEPHCFNDLPGDSYLLIASPPDGYTLTTSQRRLVNLQTGSRLTVGFGVTDETVVAPPQTAALPEVVIDADDDGNPLQRIGLMIFAFAGAMLLVGVGVTFVIRSRYR